VVKVGIVGAGAIAGAHAEAIRLAGPQVSLVAVADVAPDRLAAFADAHGVARRHSSAAELIADPEVELVAVATPPAAHEDAVVAALDAGKYVLCEKPLAHSLASAERIAAAEARRPGRLSVSHQLRYDPRYRRMLWLIQQGWIGEPREAIVERHGYIWQSTHPGGGWWGAWDVAGGGALMTQMIHELDIMLLAMGTPRSVRAQMDTRFTSIESEDWIEAAVDFGNGRTARCAASVNSGFSSGRLEIVGALGRVWPGGLMLDDPQRQAKAIAAADAALPETRQRPAGLVQRGVRKALRQLGRASTPADTPHSLLYRDIARAMAAGEPLPIPSSEAMKSLQLCAGAYEAAISGKATDLPLGPEAGTHGGVSKAAYAARARPPQPEPRPVPVLAKSKVVRVGLIGLDTTHAPTFTTLLHDPYAADHIPGAQVTAAFPGGSLDMSISASRVGAFTAELRDKFGVPILDSPEEVADAADVVFILSADGRSHPGLFKAIAGRGKPVFIDKPFAVSTADAERIYAIARETGTKVFATSAFRYADRLVAALNEIRSTGETIKGCTVRYWGQIQPTQGRFFWYGIHGAEMLMAVMGEGARAVAARSEGSRDVIEVEHRGGRRSAMVGDLNDGTFHVSIETDRRTHEVPADGSVSPRVLAAALDVLTPGGYPRLWRASDAGSVSGRPGRALDPDEAETLDVIALLDAAQRSHASGRRIEL